MVLINLIQDDLGVLRERSSVTDLELVNMETPDPCNWLPLGYTQTCHLNISSRMEMKHIFDLVSDLLLPSSFADTKSEMGAVPDSSVFLPLPRQSLTSSHSIKFHCPCSCPCLSLQDGPLLLSSSSLTTVQPATSVQNWPYPFST